MKQKSFCIVGFGKHSQSKIIPAINKINGKIVGIVSKNKNDNYLFFSSLRDAFMSVTSDTIFILCTPPDLHYTQALDVINHGYNLFIEKPVTIKLIELKEIIELSKYKKTFFVESYMYEYSKFYKNFIKFYKLEKNNIKKIDINFTLPKLPDNTFRHKDNNYPVNLFDIGCYGISLINNISYKSQLTIKKILNKGEIDNEKITMASKDKNIVFRFTFGIDKLYKNFVKVTKNDEKKFKYEPFFFGREGNRFLHIDNGTDIISKNFYEQDCFKILFKKTNKYWFDTQTKRNRIMLNNLSSLEKLTKQYNDIK